MIDSGICRYGRGVIGYLIVIHVLCASGLAIGPRIPVALDVPLLHDFGTLAVPQTCPRSSSVKAVFKVAGTRRQKSQVDEVSAVDGTAVSQTPPLVICVIVW